MSDNEVHEVLKIEFPSRQLRYWSPQVTLLQYEAGRFAQKLFATLSGLACKERDPGLGGHAYASRGALTAELPAGSLRKIRLPTHMSAVVRDHQF